MSTDRCECGKPASHLAADENSTEWGCRVPNFDPQTGRIIPTEETTAMTSTLTATTHTPWCNQAEHARVQSEHDEPTPECIGREYVITLSGQEYGHYWRQQPNGDVRLASKWPGLRFVELSTKDVRAWFDVLLHFGASRDVDQVTNMLASALDELEGSDAWRGSAL